MDDDDFMRLQDDGCPHAGEHLADIEDGGLIWVRGHLYTFVRWCELRSRRSRRSRRARRFFHPNVKFPT